VHCFHDHRAGGDEAAGKRIQNFGNARVYFVAGI
jgi:hypothetical protein